MGAEKDGGRCGMVLVGMPDAGAAVRETGEAGHGAEGETLGSMGGGGGGSGNQGDGVREGSWG